MVELRIGKRSIQLAYPVRIPGVSEEQFEALVDEDTRAELIDGVLVVHSPASLDHDDVSGFLRALQRIYAEGRGLGKVNGPDSLIHLATCRLFGPDAYFLQQLRVLYPSPKVFEGAPDQVLEILSPSNRDSDLDDKRPAYREAGVGEIWIVDPENRQLLMDRKRRRRYATETVTTGRVHSEVIQGVWIDVDWLWMEPLPNSLTCLQQILATP
jgi:Uma2 family endonuclease